MPACSGWPRVLAGLALLVVVSRGCRRGPPGVVGARAGARLPAVPRDGRGRAAAVRGAGRHLLAATSRTPSCSARPTGGPGVRVARGRPADARRDRLVLRAARLELRDLRRLDESFSATTSSTIATTRVVGRFRVRRGRVRPAVASAEAAAGPGRPAGEAADPSVGVSGRPARATRRCRRPRCGSGCPVRRGTRRPGAAGAHLADRRRPALGRKLVDPGGDRRHGDEHGRGTWPVAYSSGLRTSTTGSPARGRRPGRGR